MSNNAAMEEGEVRMRELGKKYKEEEEEKDHLSIFENIYYGFVWMAVTSIMIWFIVGIAQQYSDSNSSPATIITYESPPLQNLSMVTICNWNSIVAPYDPCYFCDLQLIKCMDIANNDTCELTHLQIAGEDPADGVFNCYQFNYDVNNVRTSTEQGYAGSFSALFLVVNPPEDDILRIGLQVSLTKVGEAPNVFGEDKFAPPGLDSYFAIQTVNTTYDNFSDPISTLRYDASYSTTALTRKNNETHSYVGVSWAFQTLSVQQITYEPQYTLNNFFGDFAGMIGTLMGLDVVKLAAGVHVAIQAVKIRNIYPLQEHFNG